MLPGLSMVVFQFVGDICCYVGLYFSSHSGLKSGLQYFWGTPIGTPLEYSMELIHVLQLPV